MAKKENQIKQIVLKGVKLIKATHGGNKVWNNRTHRYDVDSENIVTALTLAELTPEHYELLKPAYEGVASNFVPKWFTDADGFINLKSWFEVPVMGTSGETYSDIVELIESCSTLIGSTVNIAIDIKKGSVYPHSLKITEYGEERNPFENL